MIFQSSSLTFGQAKKLIAEAAGKQQTPEFLDRAGRAIQNAIRRWNQQNWKWTVQQTTFAVTAGTSQYLVPPEFRDVYTLRLEGATLDRTLVQRPRRDFDRRTWRQINAFTVAYDILWVMPQGKLELLPTPNAACTANLRYYARMSLPSNAVLVISDVANWAAATDLYNTGTGTTATLFNLTVPSTAGLHVGNEWKCSNAFQAVDGITPFSLPLVGSINAIVDSTTVRVTVDAQSRVLIGAASGAIGGTLVVGGDDAFMDIPDTYLDAIMDLATAKFLRAIGSSPERVNAYQFTADQELANAMGAENDPEDMDYGFEPPTAQPNYPIFPGQTII